MKKTTTTNKQKLSEQHNKSGLLLPFSSTFSTNKNLRTRSESKSITFRHH